MQADADLEAPRQGGGSQALGDVGAAELGEAVLAQPQGSAGRHGCVGALLLAHELQLHVLGAICRTCASVGYSQVHSIRPSGRCASATAPVGLQPRAPCKLHTLLEASHNHRSIC